MSRETSILCMIILISGFANGVRAADIGNFETYENACIKGSGTSHRVGLRILLQRHPDRKKLLPKLDDMDSDKFCDCAFRKFESTFGKDNYVKFRDYRQSFQMPGMTHAQADQTVAQIYLTCFGEQIGRPGLTPKN